MQGGFHGKTLGALSVTGRPQYRGPSSPCCPASCLSPSATSPPCGPPLRPPGPGRRHPGAGPGRGRRAATPARLPERRRELCRAAGALILDEIQTGLGRLGTWWGADIEGISPDILLAGKILGGGVMPVGGVVATAEAFAPLNDDPMLHSSTFAATPWPPPPSATIHVILEEGRSSGRPPSGPLLDLAHDAV